MSPNGESRRKRAGGNCFTRIAGLESSSELRTQERLVALPSLLQQGFRIDGVGATEARSVSATDHYFKHDPAMPQTLAGQRFLVSPWGFDNISEVLKKLGPGFEHETISWRSLKSHEAVVRCDVLFVNCAFRFVLGYGKKVAPALRRFVEQGGTLYASDWAVAGVQAAFPEMVEYDMEGKSGRIPCTVVDRGLQEIVGKKLDIHFDTSWWRMTKVNSAVRVYLEAAIEKGPHQRLPIIVGFKYGRGNVLCTGFHNKAQVSEQESRLLRFLILQPILARAAADTAQVIQGQQSGPGKEIFGTVDRGKVSQPFVFEAETVVGLLCYVNWSGAGVLRLTVKDPVGKVHFERETDRPPLGCEISRTVAGRWTFQVTAVNVPFDNFPYVLTVASSSSTNLQIPPAHPLTTAKVSTDSSSVSQAAGQFKISPPPPPPRPSVKYPESAPISATRRIPPPPPPRSPGPPK